MGSCVSFQLPVGYTDASGARHRAGLLRPARARDEVRALADFRVHLRPGAFLDIVLARTIERLGSLERVDVGTVERLCPEDRAALERLYRELNGYGRPPEDSAP